MNLLKISQDEKAVYGRIMKLTGPIILQNLLSAFVTSADVVILWRESRCGSPSA